MKHIVIHRSISIFLVGVFLALAVTPAAAAQDAQLSSSWGQAQKAVDLGSVLYVKPGASGDCSSWENACELQTALTFSASGDQIWVAEGVYTPDQGIAYTSCQDIRSANSSAEDGDYLIQSGGNVFQVYCQDMAGTPQEYLTFANPGSNYSQYTANVTSGGINVRTDYSKVRLLPETLTVDISDQAFISSTGSLMHGTTQVTSMPYGVAMDCVAPSSQTGVGNINLTGTPFAIHPDETFVVKGSYASGSAMFSSNRQMVEMQGGGYCGWIAPDPDIYDPYNNTGGPVLELTYIQSERRASFQLNSGVALYGGFVGTETTHEQRDWQAHLTVLSGDIGETGDPDDNSYHVVTSQDTTTPPTLDGWTITAGNANSSAFPNTVGGGMYNLSSSPKLTNVTFTDNSSHYGGGTFNGNDSNLTLTNVTFTGNSATYIGGGMFNYDSDPTLTNITFTGNSAESGGGMANSSSQPKLANVIFSGNTATYGGGMHNEISSPTLTNVTFSGNSANSGGGIANASSTPTLTNCILWGNTADDASTGQLFGPATVTYSDIEMGVGQPPYSGTSNLNQDPRFVDAASGDLRLLPDSPAIDAGDNAALPPDTDDLDGDGVTTEPLPLDLDGGSRFADYPRPDTGSGTAPIVDLGAYEVPNTPPTISTLPDQTTAEDVPLLAIPFTIGDLEITPDELVLAAASSDETLLPLGNIVLDGAGANRTLSLTPAPDQSGTVTITLTVSDGVSSVETSFELTVDPVNDTPTLIPLGNRTVVVGELLAFTASASDLEEDPLTFSLAPGVLVGAQIDPATGAFTWTPAELGVYSLTIQVSDGGGETISETITITVIPKPTWTLYVPLVSSQ